MNTYRTVSDIPVYGKRILSGISGAGNHYNISQSFTEHLHRPRGVKKEKSGQTETTKKKEKGCRLSDAGAAGL